MDGNRVDKIIAAMDAETAAREMQRKIGEEIQSVFRRSGKPTPEQIAALRKSTVEFVEAGRRLVEVLDDKA